jgi:hypothetical protein
MNIGSLLIRFVLDTIWVSTLGLAILLFFRVVKRKPLFTERDWFALCGHTRAEVFSSHLLPRFFSLLLVVIVMGLGVGQWIAPLGGGWVLAALVPVGLGIAPVTRWWMR